MKPSKSITIINSFIGGVSKDSEEQKNDFEEAKQAIELLSQLKSVKREDVAGYQQIELTRIGSMPDYVEKNIRDISDELKELRDSVDRLTISINELHNPQECLKIIQRNLKEIKDYMPAMKEKIDEVLRELDTPLNTTQKIKISVPIIPSLVSYEQETDVPKFVADKIGELKNLVLRFK